MRTASIYIHIPFCVQKCGYCDFAVSLYREGEAVRPYLEALKAEMASRLETIGPLEAPSIYFGGGTPSLLTSEELEELFVCLKKYVRWETSTEITLEANPGTFSLDRAREWKSLGVNRVSLGVQTFDPSTLKRLGRLHSVEDTKNSFRILHEAGFGNISFDLIYGLPGEGMEQFERSLDETLDLQPDHVSLYQLAIEENTPFYRLAQNNKLALPLEEEVIGMYELAILKLESAGFGHYELQNFALTDRESVHNYRYWHHQEFLGLGVGAYSYWDGKRFGHGKSLSDYLRKAAAGDFTPVLSENITEEIRMKEMVILGLRLKKGIRLDVIEERLGRPLSPGIVSKLDRLALKKLLRKEENRYSLTLKGEHLSESVASELI